ncbi:MAG: N-acetyltransferase family protein [Pyrinomonadaceae bacterium]
MEVGIRRARAGDEERVAELLLKLVKQHVDYNPKRFADFVTKEGAAAFYAGRFRAEDARVLVAELGSDIVGFAYLEFEERNYEELVAKGVWLHDIFVEPTSRSDGVGKALMEAAIAAAAEMGGDKLLLATAAKNLAGRDFFEHFGFRPTMIEMTLDLSGNSR